MLLCNEECLVIEQHGKTGKPPVVITKQSEILGQLLPFVLPPFPCA